MRRFLQSVFLVVLSAWAPSANASPGDLDVSFGAGGVLTTPVGTGADQATALEIQPDGKIVAAGTTGFSNDVGLVRYNEDGSLDSSFGVTGTVVTDLVTDLGSLGENGNALALQEDGKVVVAGHVWVTNPDFLLIRYEADGSLDLGFGSGGIVSTGIGAGSDVALAVILQADGKVVAGGTSDNALDDDFALVRYNADGSLDADFGTAGKVITPVGTSQDRLSALALQADGKILAAGYTLAPDSMFDMALVRYNGDGSLDTGFGSGGVVTDGFGADFASAAALEVQPDGKIVVAGSVGSFGGQNSVVVRYQTDGSLDPDFGTGGVATTAVTANADSYGAVDLQADGKIIAAGSANDGANEDFTVARYNADGSLDTAFAVGGIKVIPVGAADDRAAAVRVQGNGKIVAAGMSITGGESDFGLTRLLGNTGDLALTKSSDATEVEVGTSVLFSLSVTNNGPESIGGVTVVDVLPSSLTLQASSLTVSQGSCSGTTTLTCDLQTLASGESATIQYSAEANAVGSLTNSASVTGQAVETSSANNSSAANLIVNAASSGGCSLMR